MRVHIHANCQAIPLAGMLSEVYPDWDITFFEAHAQPIVERSDLHHEYVTTADVVLAQPIHEGYRARDDLSLAWIRAHVRSTTSLIVFPSMHFAAHQASWEVNPVPGFDVLAAHLVAFGLEPEEAWQRLLSTDLLTHADIELEIATAITETKRREKEDDIDVKISPFLEDFGARRMLFHVNNHPMRETAAFITNAILERMGFAKRVPVEGHDYQSELHIPPLPTITRFLESQGGVPLDQEFYHTVRLHGAPATPIDIYYKDMILRLAQTPAEELFSSIEGRWPTIQMLRRLAANDSNIPGIERWLC